MIYLTPLFCESVAVKYKNTTTKIYRVILGGSQGSVFRPILSIMFFNDLQKILTALFSWGVYITNRCKKILDLLVID